MQTEPPPTEPRPQRVRVVLAEVARRADQDRTRAEIAEQTRVGEAMLRGLVRAQLALALRLAVVVAVGLGALPLLFATAPDTAEVKLFGIHLPWLLLGVAPYPFLVVIGWVYVRLSERNEQDFTALVERPDK
ncbi:MAG TPA: hypothetical protein VIL37_07130 [Natronosporangium sp.]